MKLVTKIILSLSLTAILQNAYAQNSDADELKKINREWLNAYITKDTAVFARIFADDFVLVSPNGTKVPKMDMIRSLANQETLSVNIDSVDIRLVTKDVGLVTAYTTFVLKIEGKYLKGKNCYQDVYLKSNGKWKAVAAHVTVLDLK